MNKHVSKLFSTMAIVFSLLAITFTSALAAQPATPLGNESVVGTLSGNAAGSFSMYEIAYPGGDAQLFLNLSYSPSDPVTSKAFGFNVYGYNGFQGRGEPNSDGTVGDLEFWYANDSATTLIVQVYNYGEQAVGYALTASGLPETAPVAEATPVGEAQAVTSETSQSESTITGSTVGNPGGGIQLHTFQYASTDESATVTMTYTPSDPSFAGTFGFTVYAPNGSVVAKGQPNGDAGTLEATFASSMAGTYGIEVWNYGNGILLTYQIELAQ